MSLPETAYDDLGTQCIINVSNSLFEDKYVDSNAYTSIQLLFISIFFFLI